MPQSLLIALVAVAEASWAVVVPSPWGVVLAWLALVTGAIAAGCASRRTGMLGKQADGSIAAWSLVAWAPWHVFARSLAAGSQWVSPWATEVHPGWYVGGWPRRQEDFEHWPAVLDLTNELPRRVDAEHYLCLPTWDGTAPSADDLERGVRFLLERRAEGRDVLVHCAYGRGRSVAVLVAALVAAGLHPTWQDAYSHVRAKRRVHLKREQRAAVAGWAGAQHSGHDGGTTAPGSGVPG